MSIVVRIRSANIALTLAGIMAFAAWTSGHAEQITPYVRPFGDNAPWNIPVAELPRHPNGDIYVNRLWNHGPGDRPGNFNVRFDAYTFPVYSTRDATTTIQVDMARGGSLDGRFIPWNPQWRPAPGSDAQIILLDVDRGIEWDFWQVEVRDGQLRAANGSRVPGDYRIKEDGNRPSRGVGIQYLAMLIRPEEIAAGRIEHALSMTARNTDGAFAVPPATKLEFPERLYGGVPTGMRFALDITDAEIDDWIDSLPSDFPHQTRRSARIVAVAMRDYGWFITDTAGGAHLHFESRVSAGPQWQELGFGEDVEGRGELLRDLLDGLLSPERIYVIVPSDQYPRHLLARGALP